MAFLDISLLSLNVYLAVIPSVILLVFIYEKDIVEKEPLKLLVTLFFLGVLIAVPILFLEQSVVSLTGLSPINYFDSFALAFFVAGLIEEIYKYIVVLIGTWNNKNFNHKYDAIVYCVFVSLGFATIENILYVTRSNFSVALLRAIISVPAHAFYAIACGYFLGLAKECSLKNDRKKILYIILSFVIPWILHGTFDFLLYTENDILLGVFFSFVALLYILSFIGIKKTHNGKLLKK